MLSNPQNISMAQVRISLYVNDVSFASISFFYFLEFTERFKCFLADSNLTFPLDQQLSFELIIDAHNFSGSSGEVLVINNFILGV